MANGFQLSQQVQVGGVPAPRVSALADDLSNLFGAVTKGAEKYAQVGEQAAKLEFMNKAASYNEELAQWKQGSVGQETNDAFWRQYDSRVEEISAELVSHAQQYKSNEVAFNTFNALALDYGSNLQMNLRPMVQQKELTAIQTNYTNQAKSIINTSKNAGVPLSIAEISAIVDGGKGFGIEPSAIVTESFSNTMDIAITDLKQDPNRFLTEWKILSDGKLNQSAVREMIKNKFGNFATYDKDNNLVPADGATYTTDEHLSKIATFVSEISKLADDGTGEEKNLYAEQIFNKTKDTLSRVKTGSMPLNEVQDAYVNNNDTIDELLDSKKTSITKTQRANFISGQIESDIEFETIIKANAIVENAIGDKTALNELATNGGKFYVSVKDRTGKNKAKTVDVTVSPEQVKNIIQAQVSNVEKFAVDKNGAVDRDVVKAIVTAIQATDGSAKSALLSETKDTVFNVAVAPIIESKQELFSAIQVQREALRSGMTPDNMVSVYDAQAYLDNLEALTKGIADNPSDKNNAQNIAKAFASAKERAMEKPKRTANVNSFVLANRNTVIDFSSGEKLADFNKWLGHGSSMPIPEESHNTFIRLYKQKYPNDATVDETKYKDMVKDEAHYIGGALWFGDKKVILPPITSSGGRKVSNYQIMGALTPEMKRLGIENLEDLENAKASVYVDRDKYGKNYLVLKYFDTAGKIFKTKTWSGIDISKLQHKEKAWYDSFIPVGRTSAEIARYKQQTKGK